MRGNTDQTDIRTFENRDRIEALSRRVSEMEKFFKPKEAPTPVLTLAELLETIKAVSNNQKELGMFIKTHLHSQTGQTY